jgi:hypothetical protein
MLCSKSALLPAVQQLRMPTCCAVTARYYILNAHQHALRARTLTNEKVRVHALRSGEREKEAESESERARERESERVRE